MATSQRFTRGFIPWTLFALASGACRLPAAEPEANGPDGPPTPRSATDSPAFSLWGPIAPSECRKPSVMPESWPDPNDPEAPLDPEALLHCRKQKQVQSWLNGLLEREDLDSAPEIEVDTDTDTAGEEVDLVLPWGYFGSSPVEVGDQVTRAAAVLLASDCPIDATDVGKVFHLDAGAPSICRVDPQQTDTIEASDYLWELPRGYLTGLEDDLQARAVAMRRSVRDWLTGGGVAAFTRSPGSAYGNGDEDAIKVLRLTYMIWEDPGRMQLPGDLEPDAGVAEVLDGLVRRRFQEEDWPYTPEDGHIDDDWVYTRVPMSGQQFYHAWDEENKVGALYYVTPETENHVLNEIIYQYLINQLIYEDDGVYLDADALLGDYEGWPGDAIDWFAYEGTALEDQLLNVLSRVVYSDLFEFNAIDYQRVSQGALLVLASHARVPRVRAAAENALHYLATKHAFSVLDGRTYTPRRRSCDAAWKQTLVGPIERSFGVLSGAFKWNDSPYGYRGVVDERVALAADCADEPAPHQCFQTAVDGLVTGCEDDANCHWRHYTWKMRQGAAPEFDRYAENAGVPAGGVDSLAAYVPRHTHHDQLEFWTAFSDYRMPRAVKSFTFDKRDGYWARAFPRYQRSHYDPMTSSGMVLGAAQAHDNWPKYFDAVGVPHDAGQRLQRTPELWFVGDSFVNVSGGMFNSFYGDNEKSKYEMPLFTISQATTCSKGKDWNAYLADFERDNLGEFYLNPNGAWDMGLQDFDAFSRPTALLTGVPTGQSGGAPYAPWGLRWFPYEVARGFMPMMAGNRRAPWRSVNVGTYKNFSYGYAQDCDPTDLLGCDALYTAGPIDLPDWGVEPYTFSLDGDTDIPVRFAVYDLREHMELQGLAPLWLITGRVWKKRPLQFSMKRFARGFWEVIPGDWYEDAGDIEALINDRHSAADFPDGTFEDIDELYRYRLVSTGEEVSLSPRLGAIVPVTHVDIADFVQGVRELRDAGDAWLDRATYYIELWNAASNKGLPLLDVKAVNDRYDYVTSSGGAPRYYACAKDGWLCVNDFHPADTAAQPRYLWVDARPAGGQWAPSWQTGTYHPSEQWPCGCGDGDWVPGPPATAVPDDCSEPPCEGGDTGGSGGADDEIGDEDDGGDETSGSTSANGSSADDEIGEEPCVSSSTQLCSDPEVDCLDPEHACGLLGATGPATCVCLDDPSACFPPTETFPCFADDDCEMFGDAVCVGADAPHELPGACQCE